MSSLSNLIIPYDAAPTYAKVVSPGVFTMNRCSMRARSGGVSGDDSWTVGGAKDQGQLG